MNLAERVTVVTGAGIGMGRLPCMIGYRQRLRRGGDMADWDAIVIGAGHNGLAIGDSKSDLPLNAEVGRAMA